MAATASPSLRRRPDLVPLLLAFAAIYLVWGSTFLAIRFAVDTLPPLLTMGTRHLAAGGLLFAWLRFRGEPLPDTSSSDLLFLLRLALCTIFPTQRL